MDCQGAKQGAARFQAPVFRATPTPHPVENAILAPPFLVTNAQSTSYIFYMLTNK